MLSQFCIRRPIFATVLSIIIVLAGLIALRVLPLSQYPDISPPTVRISTTYDGADAQTLARTVAAPIEDQLSGITGLLYYTTNIRSNGDMSISCVFPKMPRSKCWCRWCSPTKKPRRASRRAPCSTSSVTNST